MDDEAEGSSRRQVGVGGVEEGVWEEALVAAWSPPTKKSVLPVASHHQAATLLALPLDIRNFLHLEPNATLRAPGARTAW